MKPIVIACILVVIVVGIGGFIYFRNTSGQAGPATESPTAQIYTLAVLSDEVLLKKPNEVQFSVAKETLQIGVGSEIKTSKTGRAKLLYPNGTITAIDGDSYLKIEALDGNGERSRIELVFGSMWSKIRNILGAGDYYEVGTDNIVASVRGTIFAMEYRNQTATVYGLGDSVKVSSRNPQTKEAISNTSVTVESGEKVTVSGTPSASVSATPQVQIMSDTDLTRDVISRYILELDEKDIYEHKGIEKLLRRLRNKLSPSPTPTRTPTPTPRPSPTPTPDTSIHLESVVPGTVAPGQKFTINGVNFMVGNTKKVSSVRIGSTNATFSVIDSLTIFATVPSSSRAGTYDIRVVSTSGTTATLAGALTIQ